MSSTLFSRSARTAIHIRIDQLSLENSRQWGTMSVRQMVCHVADQLRVANGDIETRPGRLRLRFGDREVKVSPGLLWFRQGRRLLVHWLPWPKARVGAPPEMFTTTPGEWNEDVSSLHVLVDRVGEKHAADPWAAHPVFGPISGREWGLLCWKHLDYHLRQFGA